MKLLRLKLNAPFRSLQSGFEIHFLREWDYDKAYEFNPYCLVGRNGSGKSNILEALASIFYHLESMYLDYRPDDFVYDEEENPNGFQSEHAVPDAFELEYFYPQFTTEAWGDERGVWGSEEGGIWGGVEKKVAHISVVKEASQSPKVYWLNRKAFQPTSDERDELLSRTEVRSFLPSKVLAYSSGENEILSLPFFKMRFIHYDEYVDRLTKALDYNIDPEGRLVYLDNQFSQAILLCNYLMQEPHILKPFQKEVGFKHIKKFRIIIRKHHVVDMDEEFLQTLSSEKRSNESETKIELTSMLTRAIEQLEKCTTTKYYNSETDELFLDYWVNEATRKAFQFHFGDSLTLFQTFQILLTLNLYKVKKQTKKELYQSDSLYVNETIPTPPSEERIMRFKDFMIKKEGVDELILSKSLSDGEHQFLHSLGLCLLFKDQPNLFLLDEPGTHLNPDWRSKFISSLRECLEMDDAKNMMREILITSHSPFVVSDCKKENVFIFDKGEARHPEINTYGTSVSILLEEIFDKKETISSMALSDIEELKKLPMDTLEEIQKIKEASRILGESVEKVLLFRELLLKEKSIKENNA